jgi:hypothetical protein
MRLAAELALQDIHQRQHARAIGYAEHFVCHGPCTGSFVTGTAAPLAGQTLRDKNVSDYLESGCRQLFSKEIEC